MQVHVSRAEKGEEPIIKETGVIGLPVYNASPKTSKEVGRSYCLIVQAM